MNTSHKDVLSGVSKRSTSSLIFLLFLNSAVLFFNLRVWNFHVKKQNPWKCAVYSHNSFNKLVLSSVWQYVLREWHSMATQFYSWMDLAWTSLIVFVIVSVNLLRSQADQGTQGWFLRTQFGQWYTTYPVFSWLWKHFRLCWALQAVIYLIVYSAIIHKPIQCGNLQHINLAFH